MKETVVTLASASDAYNFSTGQPVVIYRHVRWWMRALSAIRGRRVRWQSTVAKVDVGAGTITIAEHSVHERWSWFRWRWEAA